MPVYTVHAPVNNGADLPATDKFVFARDGFHFWAMIFGVFWLAWHRLWLALIGWILADGGRRRRTADARHRARRCRSRSICCWRCCWVSKRPA